MSDLGSNPFHESYLYLVIPASAEDSLTPPTGGIAFHVCTLHLPCNLTLPHVLSQSDPWIANQQSMARTGKANLPLAVQCVSGCPRRQVPAILSSWFVTSAR